MNKAVLIGRLVRDPETRILGTGTTVTTFTLAVDRNFKNRDGNKEADFIPIVVWNKTAELCERYLTKGSMTAVSGRIQTRSYDAADGTKRYVTEVVADEVQFLQSRNDSSSNSARPSGGSYSADESFGVPMDEWEEISDDSVPF